MAKDTAADLAIVHQYMDKITTFIQDLVQKDSAAIVLTCQVFQEHNAANKIKPFPSEADRLSWLISRSRELAVRHLKKIQYADKKKIIDQAIAAAIHDYPQVVV